MPSILIVDDDPNIALLFSKYLSYDKRIEARTAFNGENALQEILKEQPDLIITDIYMPEMDGLTLIERLDQLQIKIPTIIVSGLTTDQDKARAKSFGIDEVLPKPVRLAQLKEAVDIALGTESLDEVRNEPRHPARLMVRHVNKKGGAKVTFDTETVDCSLSGLCFKWYLHFGDILPSQPNTQDNSEESSESTILDISIFDSENKQNKFKTQARIVHRIRVPDLEFDFIGAEFVDLNAEDRARLQELLDQVSE